MKKIICIVGVILVCIPILTQAQLRRIVIIGSSTAAGTGASSYNNSWVGRLTTYYNTTLSMPVTFSNLAKSGANVYNGMPWSFVPPAGPDFKIDSQRNVSMAYDLLADVPTASDGVVIVNFPSNWLDVLPIADIMRCFRTIRDSATRRGNRCFISTTQPRDEGLFVQPLVRARMKQIRDSIVEQFGAFALDFWTPLADPDGSMRDDLKTGDNIHINNDGHLALFNVVQPVDLFGLSPLPLTWGNFTARIQQEQVQLNWSTLQEINTSHFVVEHSTNGREYKTVGTVSAVGNAASTSYYAFTHTSPLLKGFNFYRLKQVDEDGHSSLSTVSAIDFKSNKAVTVRLTPNPVQNVLQANVMAKDISLTIIDINGRVIKKQVYQPGLQSIDMQATPAGHYRVVVYQQGKWVETLEFIKL